MSSQFACLFIINRDLYFKILRLLKNLSSAWRSHLTLTFMENSQSNNKSKSFIEKNNQFNTNYNPINYSQSVISSQKSEE